MKQTRSRLARCAASLLVLILASSCGSSEKPKKPTPTPANQSEQPAPIADSAASRAKLNEKLLTELSTIVPTEAGETESPDSVKLVVELLAQGAAIDAETGGEPPIILAASGGHIIALKMLLDRGAKVNAQDSRGGTALFYAANSEDYVMVQLLLARGANPNIKDENGFTVLEATEKVGGSPEPRYRRTRSLLKQASGPGFKPAFIKDPPLRSPTQRAILHCDNVNRVPLARTLEDAWTLKEAIQANRDLEALGMMHKGKFTMVPNDSEIELLETNILHCRVKVTSSGRTGWVLCNWVNRIR